MRDVAFIALGGCISALAIWSAIQFGDIIPLCALGWGCLFYVVMSDREGTRWGRGDE